MLIFFLKERIVINADHIVSIKYFKGGDKGGDFKPCLQFLLTGGGFKSVDILFDTESKAMGTLWLIAEEFDRQTKVLLI